MSAELAAGLLVALVLVVLVLAGAIASAVVAHPERIRAGLTWIADQPVVARIRSRYPRQWHFVRRRFMVGEVVGLALTLGVAAVLTLGVVFGQLLDSVLESDGVTVADAPVVGFLAAHREPWVITGARVISEVGSPVGAALTALLVGGALAWFRRSWQPLLVVALGAGGIGVIGTAIKDLVGRNRPMRAEAVLSEHGFSFPSGHTTGTTVVWLLSAWMLTCWVVSRPAFRVMVWTGSLLMIVAVGATRIYLGVHFPTDVLAGWALGAAWAVTVALVVNVWDQSRWIPLRLRGSS
ncbi:MAG: phosphatase PAP2 family protein [Pseudonocardiaceae bacterium]